VNETLIAELNGSRDSVTGVRDVRRRTMRRAVCPPVGITKMKFFLSSCSAGVT